MPMEGERGVQSKRYLRDLFAPFGTSSGTSDPGSEDIEYWEPCVIRGVPELPEWNGGKIQAGPFIELLRAASSTTQGDFVAAVRESPLINAAISHAASALGITDASNRRVAAMAEAAAAILTQACREGESVRATSIDDLGERIFSNTADPKSAVRGLMLARALPEAQALRAKVNPSTPSFRVHCFVRNLEGLFAAPSLAEGGSVLYGNLGVERGMSHAQPALGETRGPRLFEMLYCEACGDLFMGGQRGRATGTHSETELLPSSTELEGLPERAAIE